MIWDNRLRDKLNEKQESIRAKDREATARIMKESRILRRKKAKEKRTSVCTNVPAGVQYLHKGKSRIVLSRGEYLGKPGEGAQ